MTQKTPSTKQKKYFDIAKKLILINSLTKLEETIIQEPKLLTMYDESGTLFDLAINEGKVDAVNMFLKHNQSASVNALKDSLINFYSYSHNPHNPNKNRDDLLTIKNKLIYNYANLETLEEVQHSLKKEHQESITVIIKLIIRESMNELETLINQLKEKEKLESILMPSNEINKEKMKTKV